MNKALESAGLDANRETVGLDRSAALWIDVEQFHQLLNASRAHARASSEEDIGAIEPLTRAVELYRDDFMAGFSLRDSATFDDWQFFQAESLRRELASAALDLLGARGPAGSGRGCMPTGA